MNELLLVLALVAATSEQDVKRHVVQGYVPQTIATQVLDIDTYMLTSTPKHDMRCWTTNIMHSDGSFTPKVQCN